MSKIYKTKNNNNIFKQLRIKTGLTQIEVAKRLNVVQTAVSKWESGLTTPDQKILPKIAELYETTTDYLLGRSDTPNPTQPEKTSAKINDWLKLELDNRALTEKLSKLPQEHRQAIMNIFEETVKAFFENKHQ